MRILLITIIAALVATAACNGPSKRLSATSIDSVKHTIHSLRQHGFFENYKALSDAQLFDTLHQLRIKGYSEMFERFYDPGLELVSY